MGSTLRIYGAHPSMCTHRHTMGENVKIGEISDLGFPQIGSGTQIWDTPMCLLGAHTVKPFWGEIVWVHTQKETILLWGVSRS